MSIDSARILTAIEGAVFTPDQWPEALQSICAAINGRTAALLKITSEGAQVMGAPSGYELVQAYVEGAWGSRDIRSARSITRQQNLVVRDRDIASPDERSGEFYRGYCEARDVPHMAGWHFSSGGETYAFSLLRSKHAGDFTQEEVGSLQAIANAASMAAALSSRFASQLAGSVANVLELNGHAAIILDGSGKVLHLNESAERILSQDLRIIDGFLTSNRPAIAKAIGRITAPGGLNGERPCTFHIPRTPPSRGISVCAIRMRGAAMDLFAQARTVFYLNDLDQRRQLNRECLAEQYRLTPRELEVTQCLVNGMPAKSIAEFLGQSVHTTRTMMKSIYEKPTSAVRVS